MGHRVARHSRRLFVCLSCGLAALIARGGVAQSTPGNFEPLGVRGDRAYFSQLPFESIDMVTGNLSLRFTDVVLPGNAGMNVAIARTMNYGGGASGPTWSVSLSGVPIAIVGVDAPASGQVGVLMGSGSRHTVPYENGVDTYVLDNFMEVTLSTRTVKIPNGWIATYEDTAGVVEAQLEEVRDPYDNFISATWLPRPGGQPAVATKINEVRLHGVNEGVRTVFINYDATGTRPESLSSQGRTSTYSYTDGQLTAVDPPAGPGWEFAYGANQLTVTTPNDGTVTYEFQDVTDPDGHMHPVITTRTIAGRAVTAGTWTFSFNRSSSPVVGTVNLPDGRRLEYRHEAAADPSGGTYWRLTQAILARGSSQVATVDRTYTACGDGFIPLLSTMAVTQDGRTYDTTLTYGPSYEHNCDFHRPRQIVESGDLTRTTTHSFWYLANRYRGDLVEHTTVQVGGESIQTSFNYDTEGFRVSETTAGIQTQFAPDGDGNLQSTTDPNGQVTSFAYQWGVLKDTQTPQYAISRTIDQTGVVESETRRGITVEYDYDLAGRVIGITAPGYEPITITHFADSVVTTQGSASTETDLDGFGRNMRTDILGSGVYTTTQYDAVGRVVSRTAPSDATATATDTYAYDDLDRVIGVTHSGGGSSTTTYTGTTVVTTDENGRNTTQHLARFSPGDGRITAVTDPAGQVWQYAYNMFGSLTSATQPGGSVRTFQYDTRNRPIAETHPESGTTTYVYDDSGNPISKTDARGITMTYAYDGNHRLTSISGIGSDSVTMAYDESDNRVGLTNGSSSSTFVYNNANQLVVRTDSISGKLFSTTYGYDGRGNLTSLTYPSGLVINYDHDAANRVTRVYDGSTGVEYASGLAYHPSGGLKAMQLGNGTAESAAFDGRYRVAQLSSGPLSLGYAYDPVGNVTSITDARPDRSAAFTYDALDRLRTITGWGTNEYSYDALGNRTWEANGNVDSTYDASLRLTQTTGFTPSSYTYDNVGNMTANASGTYEYTPFNLMRAATVDGVSTAYGYDGDNQRIIRSGPEGVTYTVRAGALVLAEYRDAGGQPQLVREYVYLGSKLIASIEIPNGTPPPVSVTLTSPATGTTQAGAAVTFSAQAQSVSGGVDRVEFYSNGLPLGSDTTAPYSIVRNDLPVGTHRILARVVATSGSVASSAVATLTIEQPNAPPSVSLTAPATGAVVGTGTPLTITASASDLEGIDRVEFYRGSVLLGTDTVAPYAHTWASPTNGSYTLTAKAFDVLGLSTTSAPVPITVQPVATVSVAPVSPTAGSAAVLTIDGASFCTAVRIYFGDGQETTLLDDGGLPMTTSYAWATAGPKTITAMGLGGACESQAQKSISVLTPPTVSMTSPATGTIFSPPATIGLAASATAAQGTISKVEFFANGTLLTTDTTAPYSYSWPSVPEGTYALTARATDTMGAVATSSSVTAIVGNPPPSTVLGVSVSQAVAGQPATVTVVGTNPCAWVWLEFGDGDWWLGPIGSLPFNTSKTWASSGTYTVLARGWDTCLGEVTTQVTVSSGAPAEVLASVEIPNADARRGLTETRAGMSGSEPEWLDHDGWAEEAVELPDGSVLPAAPERARTLPAALHLEPAAPAVTIHVDVNGTGSGTVSGSVSCSGSSTTCPAQFNPGQGVTLTASAAPGSVFTGWTGVCATTGSACGFGAVDGLVVIANFQSTSTPVTKYYHLDTLGSVRALTDASGAVLERHDYRPFGEDTMPLPAPGSDPARFLGQQRDSTQLDYFGARYYSMFHGRFTGVDPVINPSAIVNPQRWNRYAYSQNNPLRFVDPTGLDFVEDTNPIMDPDYICSAICQENESNWDALRELDWWWQFEEFRAERQGSEGAQLSVNDIINQLPPGTAAAVATAVTQAIIPYILAGALPGMPTIIPGGYRETGFDIHRAADGSFFFAQYVPGPDVFPFPGQTSYGQLTPYRPTFADPNIGIRITGLAFAAAHVHPANYPIPPWSAGPSDDDRKRLSQGAIGIIISPNNNRIYFYGSRVRRGTQDMSLGDFYRRAK